MKKTLAIPAKLLKSYLSDAERAELANYGDKPMNIEEITAREQEELEAAAEAVKNARREARKKILNALEEIDRKSIRALRTKDEAKLSALEAEAEQLRNALQQGDE